MFISIFCIHPAVHNISTSMLLVLIIISMVQIIPIVPTVQIVHTAPIVLRERERLGRPRYWTPHHPTITTNKPVVPRGPLHALLDQKHPLIGRI